MSIADDVRKKLNSKDKEIPEYFSDDSETQRKITFNVDDLIIKNSNTISLTSNIIGIIYIMLGILFCITVIGAIAGIPLINVALKIFDSAKHLKKGISQKNGEKIKTYFDILAKALKLLIIVTVLEIILIILYFRAFR
ncbi:DUF5362 domain-containing protein [Pseudoleptotrichia goodfellowii]|uniref:DUF5362 domain-containing protein n=1 Tax=Pseudoleptotrichia goodfellowii F0264 TaxID=596323 RepID=D0GN41_9FUSO|nr:DUF5362 domain-containing protein [Pseudoleptotrichia goodfellowii]EEY34491.1 hypothetical protein HMPREF0554_0007 [Pseudoleptotrichia goodfellowii F0264]